MTTTLTIELRGVAAVGPGWPRKSKRGRCKVKGPLWAVMPVSSRRQNAWSIEKPQGGRSFIPVHFPVILTKSTDWDEDQRVPDVHKTQSNPWSVWYPDRERLEFVIDGNAKPGDIHFAHDLSADDEGYPEGDVHHLADMRRVFPGRAKLRRGMRPGRKVSAPAANQVGAQILVPYGHARSCFRKPNEWKMKFEPVMTKDGKPVIQRLAATLQITCDVKESVEIRSWSLDTGEQLDSIAFEPSEDLHVIVANADPSDLFAMMSGTYGTVRQIKELTSTEIDSSRDGQPDYDFELYYELLKGKATKKLPVPVNYDPTVGWIRNCFLVFVEG